MSSSPSGDQGHCLADSTDSWNKLTKTKQSSCVRQIIIEISQHVLKAYSSIVVRNCKESNNTVLLELNFKETEHARQLHYSVIWINAYKNSNKVSDKTEHQSEHSEIKDLCRLRAEKHLCSVYNFHTYPPLTQK